MRVELTEAEHDLIQRCIESYRHSDSADWTALDRLAERLTPPERLTAILSDVDGAPICPRCGGGEFGYEEGTAQYWPHGMTDATTGVVWLDTIGWDGVDETGDGQPGLFCDHYRGGGCGAPIDLPDGWEVEFS